LPGRAGVFYGLAVFAPYQTEAVMLSRRSPARRRTGTASVEAATVLNLIVVPLLIGVWEMGRVVHAQQVVSNAAREGARLASQGRTILPDGSMIDIKWETSTPNVKDVVYQSLVTGGLPGIQKSDVTITCEFIAPYVKKNVSDPDPTEPFNAQKGQRFRVTVSVPFSKVRWVNLGLVNPSTISYQVDWFILVDDPFNVNTNMPSW
jgi:Flp pilus assembly protein TadG